MDLKVSDSNRRAASVLCSARSMVHSIGDEETYSSILACDLAIVHMDVVSSGTDDDVLPDVTSPHSELNCADQLPYEV